MPGARRRAIRRWPATARRQQVRDCRDSSAGLVERVWPRRARRLTVSSSSRCARNSSGVGAGRRTRSPRPSFTAASVSSATPLSESHSRAGLSMWWFQTGAYADLHRAMTGLMVRWVALAQCWEPGGSLRHRTSSRGRSTAKATVTVSTSRTAPRMFPAAHNWTTRREKTERDRVAISARVCASVSKVMPSARPLHPVVFSMRGPTPTSGLMLTRIRLRYLVIVLARCCRAAGRSANARLPATSVRASTR
jgi:hypothetical protein